MKSRLTEVQGSPSPSLLPHFLLHGEEMRGRSSYKGENELSSFEVAVVFSPTGSVGNSEH